MKIRVYWNFNKKCWSLLYKGKVIGYASSVLLNDVKFIVLQSGRKRVLSEKRKNVHAFAEGKVIELDGLKPSSLIEEISYNPYKFDHFYNMKTLSKIENSKLIYCGDKILHG